MNHVCSTIVLQTDINIVHFKKFDNCYLKPTCMKLIYNIVIFCQKVGQLFNVISWIHCLQNIMTSKSITNWFYLNTKTGMQIFYINKYVHITTLNKYLCFFLQEFCSLCVFLFDNKMPFVNDKCALCSEVFFIHVWCTTPSVMNMTYGYIYFHFYLLLRLLTCIYFIFWMNWIL